MIEGIIGKKPNTSHYLQADDIPHLSKFQDWINLQNNLKTIQNSNPSTLFVDTQDRATQHTISTANIEFNYGLQPINNKTIQALCTIADNYELHKHIDRLFSGAKVNISENKPALHTALRADNLENISINNQNIIPEILKIRSQTLEVAELIRQNKWFKNLNKKVTDLVNIGIGGSDLGPKMAVYALQEYHNTPIKQHFLSNNDPKYIKSLLNTLDLNSTVFIVTSKSFKTQETIANLHHILSLLGDELPVAEHIIAITSNIKLARKYNIKHILPIPEWIGGRFSFCSAVNLILAIMIGSTAFLKILKGAKEMDNHFRNTPYNANIPVLSALLEIWNTNFFKSNSHLLLTYSHFLKYLPEYLQQLEMESNGKSMDLNNSMVNYTTSPIVWGGLGSHAEHAYYQLLMQGTHFNTIDYFFVDDPEYNNINQIAYRKIQALAKGIGSHDAKRFRLGINIVTLNKLSPEALGSLISMYEHKTYCQSILWNINAFDQPGITTTKTTLEASSIS